MNSTVAYIGLGANLGDALDTVRQALARLEDLPATRLTAQSSLFRSAPWEASGNDFINAVAQLHTSLGAEELLRHLQALELEFGRKRPYRNAPRTLDLDLLLHGEETIASPSLTVPHPRMAQRAFVLLPLLQLAPEITIPGLGPARRFLADVAGQEIARLP